MQFMFVGAILGAIFGGVIGLFIGAGIGYVASQAIRKAKLCTGRRLLNEQATRRIGRVR